MQVVHLLGADFAILATEFEHGLRIVGVHVNLRLALRSGKHD